MCFSKLGGSVWLSHLDTGRAIQRALRRSALPLRYSEGFSPHPRLAFGPALPVGVGGRQEYFDVQLGEEISAEKVAEGLAGSMADRMEVREARQIPADWPSLSEACRQADYLCACHCHAPDDEVAIGLVGKVFSLTGVSLTVKNESKQFFLDRSLLAQRRLGDGFEFALWVDLSVPPAALIDYVATQLGENLKLLVMERLALWVVSDGGLVDPFGRPGGSSGEAQRNPHLHR